MTPVWFVDTNVLLDFLVERQPFFAAADAVFEAASQGRMRIIVTITSLSTAYYVHCRTIRSAPSAIESMRRLSTLVAIAPATDAIVAAALAAGWPDFEDALQYFAARAVPNVTAIITRDPAGFARGALPVLSPAAALALLA